MKREPKSTAFLLRLRPVEKADLQAQAERAGVTLSHAFREGAKQWLAGRGA